MNQLTEQELKTLREAEDILFNHIEYGIPRISKIVPPLVHLNQYTYRPLT